MIFAEKLIMNAMKEASKILMDGFGGFIKGTLKENQSSIVTEMDVAAERKIAHLISRKYPDHSIIGEEKGAVLTGSEYTWIIDPIDGTSNYAAGIPWFGILLAVLRHDQPMAAGAYLPFYDQMYYAERGKGAFRNGKPIRVSGEQNLKNVLIAYATDFSEDAKKTRMETDILHDMIKNVRNIRGTNSLIDFCYVADGRLGAAINYNCKIWDIAALYLIIHEAGGKMTDLNGRDIEFDLNVENYLKNYQVVGAADNLHEPVIRIIGQHF
ncbi:MAG: inositol monophosphatase [Cyclobacteriaceae bacterium]|nr:inositol monophosphatase [Cyclobacteriaceae bacterium]